MGGQEEVLARLRGAHQAYGKVKRWMASICRCAAGNSRRCSPHGACAATAEMA